MEKDEVEGYLCTLLFAPEEEPSHWYDVYLNEDGTTNGFMVLFTVLFFAMLVGLLYFLWPILFGKKEDKTVTVEEIYQNHPDEKKEVSLCFQVPPHLITILTEKGDFS